MKASILSVLVCVLATTQTLPYQSKSSNYSYPFPFVTREEWGARPPGYVSYIEGPAPFVVLHHSYIPPDCSTRDTCIFNMAYMQDMHQITNGWEDIGYNFGIGGDGAVYEGRGWGLVGAHAVGYNVRSVGIVMIGDFVSKLPPANQMEAAQKLIATGVQLGYISPDYKLIGHRQVSATECPGEALFTEISQWDRFVSTL